MKYFLRYIMFAAVPYLLARQVEKIYLKSFELDDDLSVEVENANPISKINDTDSLEIRGEEFLTVSGILAFLLKDFALKVAVTGAIGSTIWADLADVAVSQIVKYSSSIIAAPGLKFVRIIKKLRRVKGQTVGIKELLLDKSITNTEKLELLKVKIQYALKNLGGKKRVTFICTLLALLVFLLGNNTPSYLYFMANLREILGGEDDKNTIKIYLIELYREYNAPLPEKLITRITNELQ
jgi:hypothetical protein